MRRIVTALCIAALLAGCKQTGSTADDSIEARTEDAATRARKKAEAIKADEAKKAQEANDAMKD